MIDFILYIRIINLMARPDHLRERKKNKLSSALDDNASSEREHATNKKNIRTINVGTHFKVNS